MKHYVITDVAEGGALIVRPMDPTPLHHYTNPLSGQQTVIHAKIGQVVGVTLLGITEVTSSESSSAAPDGGDSPRDTGDL